jgi:hypothetical protein
MIAPLVWMGGVAMAGPLAAAMVSWVVTARTERRAPDRMTAVMMTGMAARMVFFGAYVVALVRVAGLRPVPFVVGFAAFFIGLHVIEALFLKRLFAERTRPASGA